MALPLSETGFDETPRKQPSTWSSEQMKLNARSMTALLTLMTFASGCATLPPPIQVLSRECVWVERLQWSTEQADQLVDCCPDLARQMLRHNLMREELCR